MLFVFRSGQHFVKFVNMLMNDTTYLLDESMTTLKSIRELQDLMDSKIEWEKLSRVNYFATTLPVLQQRRIEIRMSLFIFLAFAT